MGGMIKRFVQTLYIEQLQPYVVQLHTMVTSYGTGAQAAADEYAALAARVQALEDHNPHA